MPLFRRKAARDDPYGRGQQADEAIGEALGLPQPHVRPITDILRGRVTDQVCDLLPNVAHSTAPRMLVLACGEPSRVSVTAVQALRPDIAYGHAASAALPGMMLLAITNELLRRYDVSHSTAPFAAHQDTAPAVPSAGLRHARTLFVQDLDPDGMSAPRRTGVAIAQALRQTAPDPLAQAWGAWALLAAVKAMTDHQDELPEPGRARERPTGKQAGADAAGYAYQFGRWVLAGTAVALTAT